MRRRLPNAFIDQFGKELAVNEARSPLGVISSSGLRGHYFIKRFALSFESGNTVANGSKNVALFDHFDFAANSYVWHFRFLSVLVVLHGRVSPDQASPSQLIIVNVTIV